MGIYIYVATYLLAYLHQSLLTFQVSFYTRHVPATGLHTWFLKIDPVGIVGIRVFVCVCLRPRLLITSGMMWRDMNLILYWLNEFYSCYMATVVVIVNGLSLGIGTNHRH